MPSFTVFKGTKDGKIQKATTTRNDLTGDEVLVKVTASGLCGTDVHALTTGIALGHEGAGIVESIGPDVKHLKKGDRVGWGYIHSTCGQCKQCITGRETFCPDRQIYMEADTDQGSMASHGVWREAFLFRIPDNMSDKEAAPLMCGGATVFTALHKYNIKPTDVVGVIGVGGLGHLAIQFAAKMGCDVAVFSGTDSKKEEATKLGATHFFATKGVKALKDVVGDLELNFLLVTASVGVDWNLYLPVLAPECKVFPITVSQDDFSFPSLPMIQQGITLQGTMVAPREEHREMLEFAARHGIKPMINEFPMTEDGIEKAFKSLNDGKMRYRGVLVPQN